MRWQLGLIAILILTSCSVFSPVQVNPPTKYVVNTVPYVSAKIPHHLSLYVSMPTTNSVYSTSQMVYSIHPYQVAYFVKNTWAATPAEMLQSLMVQTIQNSHYYNLVTYSPTANQVNLILNTQLLEFKQDFSRHPSVFRLELRAQLLNANTGKVIAAKDIIVSEPAPENTPYGGVVAANKAVEKALSQLLKLINK